MSKKPELHPALLRKINLVRSAMSAAGMPMVQAGSLGGVRTDEQQNTLYQIGRSRPGKIVTNADGKKVRSNHQVSDDGFGHAVDCAFLVNDMITWEVPDSWWEAYGSLCKAVGLRWGIKIGDWIDRPHAELPKTG